MLALSACTGKQQDLPQFVLTSPGLVLVCMYFCSNFCKFHTKSNSMQSVSPSEELTFEEDNDGDNFEPYSSQERDDRQPSPQARAQKRRAEDLHGSDPKRTYGESSSAERRNAVSATDAALSMAVTVSTQSSSSSSSGRPPPPVSSVSSAHLPVPTTVPNGTPASQAHSSQALASKYFHPDLVTVKLSCS